VFYAAKDATKAGTAWAAAAPARAAERDERNAARLAERGEEEGGGEDWEDEDNAAADEDRKMELACRGQWTRLHQAARFGRAGRVPVLLRAGADVNAGDKEGATPLHWAAKGGHLDALTALLAAPGVAVNAANYSSYGGDFVPLSFEATGRPLPDTLALVKHVVRDNAKRSDPDDVAAVYVDKITRTLQRFSVKFRTIEAESYAAFQSRGRRTRSSRSPTPGSSTWPRPATSSSGSARSSRRPTRSPSSARSQR
jgi:hypothetical protein